jgi:hypothetical protein
VDIQVQLDNQDVANGTTAELEVIHVVMVAANVGYVQSMNVNAVLFILILAVVGEYIMVQQLITVALEATTYLILDAIVDIIRNIIVQIAIMEVTHVQVVIGMIHNK